MPAAEAEALRRFIFRPLRTALRGARRPRPFDTYHTARDAGETLDPTALERMSRALLAVVDALG